MNSLAASIALATALVLLVLAFGVTSTRAGVGELQVIWQQFLPGISAVSVVQTSDGGYLVLGENATLLTEYSPGRVYHTFQNFNQILIKTDSHGNYSWSKTYQIAGYDRLVPGQLIRASDGTFVIVSVASGVNNEQQDKVFLMKIDSQGSILWSKLLQGNNPDHLGMNGYTPTIAESKYNGFAIVTSYNYEMYRYGIWFIKVDSSGSLQRNVSLSTAEQDHVTSILQTTDGGYLLTGSRDGHSSYQGPSIAIKTDSNGTVLWEKTFGDQQDYSVGGFHSAVGTTDGGFLLAGYTALPQSVSHAALVKIDADGNTVWNRTLSPGNSGINSITPINGGGYAFAGVITSYVVWVGKIDASGNLEAQTQIRTADPYGNIKPNSIIETADGSCVFAGDWTTTSDLAVREMWLVKISLSYSAPSPSVPEFPSWVVLLGVCAMSATLFLKKTTRRRGI